MFLLSLLTLLVISVGFSQSRSLPSLSFHQFGFRAGLHLTQATVAAPYHSPMAAGFFAGVLANKSYNSLTGLRTEMTYSKEGLRLQKGSFSRRYDFRFIYFTSLFTINLGRLAQLQVGPQAGYMASAFMDTTRHLASSNAARLVSVTDRVNRVSYGACLGLEIYPKGGWIIGARYSLGMAPINKKEARANSYAFYENASPLRMRTISISVGYRFGEGIHQ